VLNVVGIPFGQAFQEGCGCVGRGVARQVCRSKRLLRSGRNSLSLPSPVEYLYQLCFLPNIRKERLEPNVKLHIMAIDCCEHVLGALVNVPSSRLTAVASRDKSRSMGSENDVDLIVIGVSRYPVRRLFISQLRRVYPGVPMLILRRLEADQEVQEAVRGEFILSEDPGDKGDLEIVRSLRKVLPIQSCVHVHKEFNYDTVRQILRVISENYIDPDLDLERVARELAVSSALLARILNQQVGVSFRRLLRQIRIEEAKRMLASRQFSVKEVAARVGFTDSHYFSRSFRELTGQSASEYRSQDPIFG
jgi:AraC-like DNA-binding protein